MGGFMNSLINNVVQVVALTTSKIYVYIISICFQIFSPQNQKRKEETQIDDDTKFMVNTHI